MKTVGCVDFLSHDRVEGWAAEETDNGYDTTELTIQVNGEHYRSIHPTQQRDDVREAGIGSGAFGFELTLEDISPDDEVLVLFRDGTPMTILRTADEPNSTPLVSSFGGVALPDLGTVLLETNYNSLVVSEGNFDREKFLLSKKICLYVTFSVSGIISKYHVDQVAELKSAGYFVVAVRAANYFSSDARSEPLGDVDILKVNVGYDFGSWWVGLQWVAMQDRDKVSSLKCLCLCNDSFYGYVDSNLIEKIERSDCDLSGVCDNYDHNHHIQSFFVIVKGKYLRSGEFARLLSAYSFPTQKKDVIRFGELLLSKEAVEVGASITTAKKYENMLSDWVMNIENAVNDELRARDFMEIEGSREEIRARFSVFLNRFLDGESLNPSHIFWRSLLTSDVRIVKRELVFRNPLEIPDYYSLIAHCVDRGVVDSITESMRERSVGHLDIGASARIALLTKFKSNGELRL